MKKNYFKILFCLLSVLMFTSIKASTVGANVVSIEQNDLELQKINEKYVLNDLTAVWATINVTGIDDNSYYMLKSTADAEDGFGVTFEYAGLGKEIKNTDTMLYINPETNKTYVNIYNSNEAREQKEKLFTLEISFSTSFTIDFDVNDSRLLIEEVKQGGTAILPVFNEDGHSNRYTINAIEDVTFKLKGYNLVDSLYYSITNNSKKYTGRQLEEGIEVTIANGAVEQYGMFYVDISAYGIGFSGYSIHNEERCNVEFVRTNTNVNGNFDYNVRYNNSSKYLENSEYNEEKHYELYQELLNNNPLVFNLKGETFENKNYSVKVVIYKNSNEEFNRNYTVSGADLNTGKNITLSEFNPSVGTNLYDEYTLYVTIGNITKIAVFSYEYYGYIDTYPTYIDGTKISSGSMPGDNDYPLFKINKTKLGTNEFYVFFGITSLVDTTNYTYKITYRDTANGTKKILKQGTMIGKELNKKGLITLSENTTNTKSFYGLEIYKGNVLVKQSNIEILNQDSTPYLVSLDLNDVNNKRVSTLNDLFYVKSGTDVKKIAIKGYGFTENTNYSISLYVSKYNDSNNPNAFGDNSVILTGKQLNDGAVVSLPTVALENTETITIYISIGSEIFESMYVVYSDDEKDYVQNSISITDSTVTLENGKLTHNLNYNINFQDRVLFSSDNDKVTIDENGLITLTDNSVTSATITLKGLYSKITVSKKITFEHKNTSFIAPILNVNVASYNSNTLSYSKIEGASSYQIYYSTSKKGKYSLLKTTSATTYTHSGLKTGTTYYYKVRAYKIVNKKKVYTSYSSIVGSKPYLKTTTLASVNNNYRYASVKWSKVSGASGYAVYRSTSETGKYTLLGKTTKLNYNDSKASEGKTYYYKVKAYRTVSRKNIYGGYSNAISSNRLSDTISYTVKNTGYGKNTITINQDTNASKYYIYRSTSKKGKYILIATLNSSSAVEGKIAYTNTKLSFNKTYYYKVKMSYVNTSDYSAIKSVKNSYVNKASITATNNNYRYASIKWNKVSGVSGYAVYRSTSETGKYTLLGKTTKLYYNDTKASEGKTYYYKVKAYKTSSRKNYYSGYSNAVSSNRLKDSISFNVSNNSYNSIKITINKDANATKYYLYRSTSKKGKYSLVATLNASDAIDNKVVYTNTGLSFNKTYYYKVKMSYINTSDYSGYKAITTKLSSPVISVEGVQLTENKVTISKVDGSTGYEIYRSYSGGKYSKIKTTASLTYNDATLKLGEEIKYTYKVRAYKKVGKKTYYSGYSNIASMPLPNGE